MMGKIAYHVTPHRKFPEVKKKGLVPRQAGQPVYLFTDFTDAKLYAMRVERMHNERFSIVEVDVTDLELHKDWTLYLDDPAGIRNLYATAVFVRDPVSPTRVGTQDLRRKSQAADGTVFRERRPVRVRPYRRRR